MFREEKEKEYKHMVEALELLYPYFVANMKEKWQQTLVNLSEQHGWSLEHADGVIAGKYYMISPGEHVELYIADIWDIDEENIH